MHTHPNTYTRVHACSPGRAARWQSGSACQKLKKERQRSKIGEIMGSVVSICRQTQMAGCFELCAFISSWRRGRRASCTLKGHHAAPREAQAASRALPSPRDMRPLSWPLMQYTATIRRTVAITSATTIPEMVGASTSMQFWHTGSTKGHKE